MTWRSKDILSPDPLTNNKANPVVFMERLQQLVAYSAPTLAQQSQEFLATVTVAVN